MSVSGFIQSGPRSGNFTTWVVEECTDIALPSIKYEKEIVSSLLLIALFFFFYNYANICGFKPST